MNPFSDSALVLRRRSVWEAADSGVLLWRNSCIYFIPFFVLPVGIAACGLRFLPDSLAFLSYLALWWLKPLFDRLILQVVSRRFFGSPASRPKDLCRGLRGMSRGLLGDLLWRRFSPVRGACLPIRVLERIGRKQFRIRKKALAAGGLGFCSLISIFGLALEGMLLLGETAFVVMVLQLFFPTALGYIQSQDGILSISFFAAFCLNYVLVESLYVCMGFGLYVNSRVEVEGWDLQLLFQKLAGPEKPVTAINTNTNSTNTNTNNTNGNTNNVAGIVTIIVACIFLALPRAVYAQEPQEPQEDDEAIELVEYFADDFPAAGEGTLERLEEILASPDFGSEKEGWGIRFKESEPKEKAKRPDVNIDSLLGKIRQAAGFILRALVIFVIAAAAGFVLFWLWRNRRKGLALLGGRGKSYTRPGLPPESPEALFARSEDFFRRGNVREAWAACLAGCLGAYARYRSLAFPVNATEYGCLDLVRRTLPAEAAGFEQLVRDWIFFAYGGRPPGDGAFERALAHGRSLAVSP